MPGGSGKIKYVLLILQISKIFFINFCHANHVVLTIFTQSANAKPLQLNYLNMNPHLYIYNAHCSESCYVNSRSRR